MLSNNLSDKDKKILNLLLENSRLSFREIAKKAGVSVVTVINRVRELEKEGIIGRYSANLNYEKAGYDVQVAINMQITKGKLIEVQNRIAKMSNVSAVYDVTGDHDSLIIAKFKNRRSLDAFLKKLQTFDFVRKTKTKLILNTIKEENIMVD